MIDFTQGKWQVEPKFAKVTKDLVQITTQPRTDLWQRTYYGFCHDNAPLLQIETAQNFTFTTKVSFAYQARFDQCGVVIYLDRDNWFKASIEFEDAAFSRLGSVVTNMGYSDWATTDIATTNQIWYRLSRRGADFLLESSLDGSHFNQMRIFHLHQLGCTSLAMGQANPPLAPLHSVSLGLYACSPLDSSFTANFTELNFSACQWLAHSE